MNIYRRTRVTGIDEQAVIVVRMEMRKYKYVRRDSIYGLCERTVRPLLATAVNLYTLSADGLDPDRHAITNITCTCFDHSVPPVEPDKPPNYRITSRVRSQSSLRR